VLLAAVVVVSLAQTIPRARRQAVESEGFNRRYWRSSATLAALRSLPPGTRIHTNAPEWVAFETGLGTRDVPVHHSRVSLLPDAEYPRALQALCASLAAGDVLVYFEGVSWRWEAPTFEDVHSACGLEEPARFDDGLVFRRVTSPP